MIYDVLICFKSSTYNWNIVERGFKQHKPFGNFFFGNFGVD